MKRHKILITWGCLTFLACSSAPRKNEHLLHNILLYNLHARRTEHPSANPRAQWDDDDYRASLKPDERMDCVSIQSFFTGINLSSLRECLNSSSNLQNAQVVSYFLKKDNAPYLELENQEGAPPCLGQILPRIPVPREIFFQSNEEGQLSCYSSRIQVRSDETLGIKTFLNRVRIRIAFPLDNIPKNDDEVLMLLTTWSISPFWREEHGDLVSRIVPESFCRKCLGDRLFLDTDSLPPHWP